MTEPQMLVGDYRGVPLIALTPAFHAATGQEMRDKIIAGLREQTGDTFVHAELN